MSELVSELSSTGTQSGPASSGPNARPIITQAFNVETQSKGPLQAPAGAASTIDNVVKQGGAPAGSRLSESTRQMLENLDKHGTITAPDKTDSPPAAPGAAVAGDSPAPPAATSGSPGAATAAPVEMPAAPTPAPTPAAAPATRDQASELDRMLAKNRELVEENTRLKQGGAKRELGPREKALDEIERAYLDDPIGAIRRLQALALGVDDPKHADIDAELSGLYQDLTAKELGVALDASQQARRESSRTRQMLAREKRERTQAEAQPVESDDVKRDREHTSLIAEYRSGKTAEGAPRADTYPALAKVAPQLSGAKAEELVLRELHRGFATGEYDPKLKDDALIEAASKTIEGRFKDLYQALSGVFAGGAPATSTAAPTTAVTTASKDEGQQQAARTITNASASVAPATTPAKPETKTAPKFKNERERREAILKQHLGGG